MDYISTKIIPFDYKSGIPQVTQLVDTLGVFNYVDDLTGNCTANWFLSNASQNILWNSYTLTQEEYDKWDSSPNGLLKIIANYLKLEVV